MSPAREVTAITFGAAAGGVAGLLGWWLFVVPPSGLVIPVVGVGGVAAGLGALVGEWVAAARPWAAALVGATVLPMVELGVLGAVFAADTVQRLTLDRPPHWGELLNPRTWALVLAGLAALSVAGGVAGLVARRWARRVAP